MQHQVTKALINQGRYYANNEVSVYIYIYDIDVIMECLSIDI